MSFREELMKHLTALPVTDVKKLVSKYNKELDIKPVSKLKKAEILQKIKDKKPMDKQLLTKLTNEARARREGMKAQKASEKQASKKAKPDFLDLDKDGDKKEPMKKAAKEAKKNDPKLFSKISKFLNSESVSKLGTEKAKIQKEFNEAGKLSIDNPEVGTILEKIKREILKKVSSNEFNNPVEKAQPKPKVVSKEKPAEQKKIAKKIASLGIKAMNEGMTAEEVYNILEKLNKKKGGNTANVVDTISNYVDSETGTGNTTSLNKVKNTKSQMKKYLQYAADFNSYFIGDNYKQNPNFVKEAESLFGKEGDKKEQIEKAAKEPKPEPKKSNRIDKKKVQELAGGEKNINVFEDRKSDGVTVKLGINNFFTTDKGGYSLTTINPLTNKQKKSIEDYIQSIKPNAEIDFRVSGLDDKTNLNYLFRRNTEKRSPQQEKEWQKLFGKKN